jgi:L-ascorbate metabolism protein UlaG (beta-lactamase superfamily)
MKKLIFSIMMMIAAIISTKAQSNFQKDVIQTSQGNLTIYFIGHATLIFDFDGKIIHVDPWSKIAEYSKLPKADLVLVTHHHFDHLDSTAIAIVSKNTTQYIVTSAVFETLKKGVIMKNGETKTVDGIQVEAVPAYNITAGHEKFHPKGSDNGYVLTLGDKRIYIAGDTENIPEMAALKNIDIAFLPMNQPYTMLPEQVTDAVSKFNPKILYPYHYGETDVNKLTELMKKYPNIEVRVRPMK